MMSTRVAMRMYEDMDVVYAAMPEDTRAVLVAVWHDRACGMNVDLMNKLIKELVGMWADRVDACRPDFKLLRRWRNDHGLA